MFHKVLLAYNGTPEGKAALLACTEIAAFSNIETHLLAVAGAPGGGVMLEGIGRDVQAEEEEKLMGRVLGEGVEYLKQRGFNVAGHLAIGEPVDQIGRFARQLNVDLIIVGHKSKTSFASRWWGGSVGKSLLHHAHCSVFVVKTDR